MIDKKAWQIEKPSHPRNNGDYMQGFYPKIHEGTFR
jgi:hypothetical protein